MALRAIALKTFEIVPVSLGGGCGIARLRRVGLRAGKGLVGSASRRVKWGTPILALHVVYSGSRLIMRGNSERAWVETWS
jgi:hypothetical protein